ncbi:MAG: TonB family protein [Candidatus Omnitrophota bacterium]
MRTIIITSFIFIFSFFSIFPFTTLTAQNFLNLEEDDKEISLIVGEVNVFSVLSPKRASIRNPEIADITKISGNEVVVVAKQGGETVLTIWDKAGKNEFFITVQPQDLDRVSEKLKNLINKNLEIENVSFKNNEVTGKIMVMGEVTPVEKANIESVLEPFAASVNNLLSLKEESKMVEIECQVLELNKSKIDQLGVNWQDYLQFREEPYSAPGTTSTGGVSTTLNKIKPWSAIWPVHLWSRDALTARINMIIEDDKGRILSRPQLMCLSGKEAKLTVGGEVPYVSSSTTNETGTGVDVEYREYGVILTLQPNVISGNRVLLNVSTEVSELDWTNAITVSSISIPAFTTREAETVLNVDSGDTIFIGGLIKNEESKNIDKVPGLANIPILGALFRSKDFQNDETELVITLTPIIRESNIEKPRPAAEGQGRAPISLKPVVFPEYLTHDKNLNEYILKVQNMIFKSLGYPRLAGEAGWQGDLKLKIHLNQEGHIIEARVIESSGYEYFDSSALDVAKSLSPYPPFPSSVELEDLWIDIPIAYRIK